MAPLTKEEKKARKEARKLEMMLAEIEKRKQMRRDELAREMAAQALRRGEVDKSWRDTIMKIKEPVFKQEIEIMWHIFERLCDKKDHQIKLLLKTIEIADDQFQRTISAFCDMIDTMINKFLVNLDNMATDNNRRTTNLLKWGEKIRKKLESDHQASELHLQLLLFHGHTTHDNFIWNMRGENMVREDEERSVFLDVRDNLQSYLENTYIKMWDEYKLVLKTYVQSTAENQKHVRRLRRKENIMADIIAAQAKKLADNDRVVARLKHEFALYESGEKQAAFRDNRNRHRAAAHRLKQRLSVGMAIDEQRLATLVRSSDEILEWLGSVHEKSGKIVRLASLCRKFETQREKVLPFGSDIPPGDEQTKPGHKNQPSEDPLVNTALACTAGLSRLWNRIARADLSRRALLREKNILERENEMLQETLSDQSTTDLKVRGTDSLRCICGDDKKKNTNILRPVAVNGALEVEKYRKYY